MNDEKKNAHTTAPQADPTTDHNNKKKKPFSFKLFGPGRKTESQVNFWIYVISFLAIVIILNVLTALGATLINLKFRVPTDMSFDLSDVSKSVLEKAKKAGKDISLTYVYDVIPSPISEADEKDEMAKVQQILEAYAFGQDHVTFENVDLNRNPGRFSEFQEIVRQTANPYPQYAQMIGYYSFYASVIIEVKDKNNIDDSTPLRQTIEVFTFTDPNPELRDPRLAAPRRIIKDTMEREITSAIDNLLTRQKKIYYLTGHLEREPIRRQSDISGKTYSYLQKELHLEGYLVEVVDIARVKGVPEDCDLLIIAEPKTPYSKTEMEYLDDYLYRGGKLIILTEPNAPETFSAILNKRGIKIYNHYRAVEGDESLLVTRGEKDIFVIRTIDTEHDLTRNLPQQTVYVQKSCVISAADMAALPDDSDLQMYTVLRTTSKGWTDKNQNRNYTRDANDEEGYTGVMAIAEGPVNRTNSFRIAVFGDADMISDQTYSLIYGQGYQFSNFDFFLNAVRWTMGRELAIPPRTQNIRRLQNVPLARLISFIVAVMLIPLGVIAIAIVTIIRRNK